MERYIIELRVIRRLEDYEDGYRTHVITLSNQDACNRVVDAIKDGKGWESAVQMSDVLEYDDKLEA